jgi:hypothetical protein
VSAFGSHPSKRGEGTVRISSTKTFLQGRKKFILEILAKIFGINFKFFAF